MTVGELIEALKKQPLNREVWYCFPGDEENEYDRVRVVITSDLVDNAEPERVVVLLS